MEAEKPQKQKNPAVKRILQELKEMQDNPSDDFISLPLESDIFDWQFAIRGPPDTEFEGGIYHGRIQLPTEYPFQPPSFMILTPNGRFETQTKICLSMSNHHPEHWQPSWSVRTALTALIAFMPTDPGGAVGSLDFPKDERVALAAKSRESSPKFGTPERQRLTDEIHQYMLSKTPPVSQLPPQPPGELSTSGEGEEASEPNDRDTDGSDEAQAHAVAAQNNDRVVEHVREVRWNAGAGPIRFGFSARLRTRRRVSGNPNEHAHQPPVRRLMVVNDRVLTVAAVALALAIAVLLCKKLMKASVG